MVKNKNDLCKWHSIKFQFIKGPYDVNQWHTTHTNCLNEQLITHKTLITHWYIS